jgi:GNAT superfamily N-acetyltransferase
LVRLLADDPLGAAREVVPDDAADLEPYRRAFALIDADPAQLLVVAADGTEVVGTLQLSVIPGLSRQGALRAQIEAVRVRADHRGHGLGEAMVQLTTDLSRADAHRFYERLGFIASHVGLKLALEGS